MKENLTQIPVDRLLPEYAGWRKEDEKILKKKLEEVL